MAPGTVRSDSTRSVFLSASSSAASITVTDAPICDCGSSAAAARDHDVLRHAANLQPHLHGDAPTRADENRVRAPRLESRGRDLDVIAALREPLSKAELAALHCWPSRLRAGRRA